MENKLVAESLHEYRDINNELNEGLFGLNDQQKAKVKAAAAKEKLEDADIDGLINDKLIKPVLDVFKIAQPGTKLADNAMKAKNMILSEPKKYKQTLLKFLKVYVQGLADTAKAKLYGLDPNTKMLMPRLSQVGKSEVGKELGA